MSAGDPPKLPETSGEASGSALPSWRRIGEFIRSILGLQNSVDSLKKDVAALQVKVEALQRQADDQAGQMKVLVEFVRGALDDRIERQVRRAMEEQGRAPGKRGRRDLSDKK